MAGAREGKPSRGRAIGVDEDEDAMTIPKESPAE
jgi:hypothetical protein